MALTDRLSDGLESVAKQAQKVFEQGKVRIEQLQVERGMDMVARRLGYMELDASRGRAVDQAKKAELLAELGRLEDELHSTLAAEAAEAGVAGEAASQAQTGEDAAAARPGSVGSDMAEAERIAQAAAATGVQPPQETEERPGDEPPRA